MAVQPLTIFQDIIVQQGIITLTDFPAILGHEGAGTVKAIGKDVKDKSLSVGDQVLLSFTICQNCDPCNDGRPTFCLTHPLVNFRGVRLDDGTTPARLKDGTAVRSQFFGQSSFARLSVVHDYSVVKCPVPEMLPCYAPLGCGFQTGAGTVLNALKPESSARVVIFGMGSVGAAALMAAAHLGVKQLVAVDLVDGKLELAKELGATHTINTKGVKDVPARIIEVTNGGAEYAIDCTGVPACLQAAVDSLCMGGTAVAVGVPPPGFKIDIETLPFFMANKTFKAVIEGQSTPAKVCCCLSLQIGSSELTPVCYSSFPNWSTCTRRASSLLISCAEFTPLKIWIKHCTICMLERYVSMEFCSSGQRKTANWRPGHQADYRMGLGEASFGAVSRGLVEYII